MYAHVYVYFYVCMCSHTRTQNIEARGSDDEEEIDDKRSLHWCYCTWLAHTHTADQVSTAGAG